MASAGEVVFKKRSEFIAEFIPTFQSFYSYIYQDKEKVNLAYESHDMSGGLLDIIKAVSYTHLDVYKRQMWELAEKTKMPIAGKDFKTGQTLVKSGFAPIIGTRDVYKRQGTP